MTITNTQIDDASEDEAELTTGETGSAVMSPSDSGELRFADLSSDDEGSTRDESDFCFVRIRSMGSGRARKVRRSIRRPR